MPFRPGLLTLALVAGCSATAQPKGDTTSSTPAALVVGARLPVTFGAVSNVVDLGGGRIAFADPKERRLHSATFAGDVDTLGTRVDSLTGAAGSYKLPGWVARLAGDTLALVDFASLGTTLWTADGRFVRDLRLPVIGGATPILVYDAVGHGYKADLTGVLGGSAPGARVRRDSLPLLRVRLADGAVDTVAQLSGPEFGLAKFGEQMQEVAKVFGPNDAFGAAADGRVWVARARRHAVDWRGGDGAWRRGTDHPWTPVPVSASDRERVMQRLRERGLPTGVAIEFPFAESKPSFEAALGRPLGEVWLQYSRASEEEPLRYAVFGAEGAFLRDVTAPVGVSVVGFGQGDAIYGTVREADGRRGVVQLSLAP
ncbi:MAG: hypothetical protein MUC69_01975 [Gemmatimonadales bacterium]|nr:hypothetical protein [Gemmatimonadales bacterium]